MSATTRLATLAAIPLLAVACCGEPAKEVVVVREKTPCVVTIIPTAEMAVTEKDAVWRGLVAEYSFGSGEVYCPTGTSGCWRCSRVTPEQFNRVNVGDSTNCPDGWKPL